MFKGNFQAVVGQMYYPKYSHPRFGVLAFYGHQHRRRSAERRAQCPHLVPAPRV